MIRKLTTARCWSDDADRLEDLRKHLVVEAGGENRTIADAITVALDAWDSAAAKREIVRFDARYVQPATTGEEA